MAFWGQYVDNLPAPTTPQGGDLSMSQMPPPPSQPAPMGGTPASASNSKTNVILAYLLWWVTGIIFLFVGKNDPDVKWNAAQSVVVLGGFWLIAFVLGFIIGPFAFIIWVVGAVYWVIFLIGAFNYKGGKIAAPGIGQFTDQLTDQVANAVK
jgi:uncharacterized membrane protein